jgi:16S rRNA processing protein RimM
MPRDPHRLIPLAEVARPHGVQGELRLKVYNPDSSLLGRGRTIALVAAEGPPTERKITSCRPTEGALLVRLEGVDDRNAAEALRGVKLALKRSDFPPAEEGEFYACDVEGARAVLVSGDDIGVVEELRSYPSVEVLVVKTTEGKSLEFPLTEAFVDEVDVDAGVVRLTTREGLE